MMEAIKHDSEKPKLGLIPPKAILGIGRALTYGANKYHNFNYKTGKGLEWERIYSALQRHYTVWLDGEDIDLESGLHHLDHLGACTVMLMDLVYSNIGEDTRFRTNSKVRTPNIVKIVNKD
jgi:hypothetical protein